MEPGRNVARARRLRSSALHALAAVMAVAPILTSAPVAAARDDALTISLVHQELALAQNGELQIQFAASAPIDPAGVNVTVHQPILNRDSLRRAIDNRFGGSTDEVTVPAEGVQVADGVVTIALQTETDELSPTALHIEAAGVYPVTVEVTAAGGGPTARLITFVDRLPPADSPPQPAISVAVLAQISAPPALPGAPTPLPAATVAALTELAKYGPDVPVSLDISPEIVGRLDAEQLAALATVMANGIVMSQPLYPFDPAAVAEAAFDDEFRKRILDGEEAIKASGLPAPDIAVWYAPDGVTNAGIELLRGAGVRLLVVPSSTYFQAAGNTGLLTDYSQLYQSVLSPPTEPDLAGDEGECTGADADCISTAVVDPDLAERFSDPELSDEQAALYTAADLVVYRDFFAPSLQANIRRALILGTDGEGVASAARMTRAVQLASATGAASFITIDQFERSSGQAIADGRPLELQLPQTTPVDLKPRRKSLAVTEFAAAGVASMLVAPNGRPERWTKTIQTLRSTSITDDEVEAAEQSLAAELQSLRDCVAPPTSKTSFTLTGRSSNLPLSLTKTCDEELKIVVHLDAAADKMDFPENDATIVLSAGPGPKSFTVPVVARTNGTFDITLSVETPARTKVFPDVTLKARINALTGLPQVITGAALLILLTWWVRNLRRSRRARRVVAANGHPANGQAAAGAT